MVEMHAGTLLCCCHALYAHPEGKRGGGTRMNDHRQGWNLSFGFVDLLLSPCYSSEMCRESHYVSHRSSTWFKLYKTNERENLEKVRRSFTNIVEMTGCWEKSCDHMNVSNQVCVQSVDVWNNSTVLADWQLLSGLYFYPLTEYTAFVLNADTVVWLQLWALNGYLDL